MAVKSDTIFFTHEKNRIGFVIGNTVFFTCEENCMTNRIASQKKVRRFLFEAFVMCKYQYSCNKITNSLVFSKMYYCSSIWLSTSASNIHKLEDIQNFGARLVSGTIKFHHVTLVWKTWDGSQVSPTCILETPSWPSNLWQVKYQTILD